MIEHAIACADAKVLAQHANYHDKPRVHSITSALRNAVMPLRLQVLAVDEATREILETVSQKIEEISDAFAEGANAPPSGQY